MIEVRDLHKAFGKPPKKVIAVDGVTLQRARR